MQRRVGRVERWLRKGYGFIIDLGKLAETPDGIAIPAALAYGWTTDEISGSKVFVYHNALSSQSDQVFHRLFAHEYVEYSIDITRPTHESRHQAFDVTGLSRSLLLCDLHTADEEYSQRDSTPNGPTTTAPPPQQSQRSRNNNRRGQQPQQHHPQHHPQPPQTIVYYVSPGPGTVIPGIPFPQQQEPNYVMTTGGIPVPK